MTQIQTTRDHDKDMLIAGFKHDLAKERAENERLRAELAEAREVKSAVEAALRKDIGAGLENERLRAALEPLARLKVPANPQNNAGAYSIYHTDIIRARNALEQKA